MLLEIVVQYVLRCVGGSRKNAENPKSKVIPSCLLCGCLSNAAVLASVLRAFAAFGT
jgi:hypothetical protein